MTTRSYFVVYPGLAGPAQFNPTRAPNLLSLQDLWEAARECPPSLLFRVRSESEPGVPLMVSDRLESCIGVVDSATRWRTVFAHASLCVAALRHPQLAPACQQVLAQIATQHPATLQEAQRRGSIEALMRVADVEGEGAPNGFEQRVAVGVAQLMSSDNDIEAAYHIPFLAALCPFSEETQRQEYQARMASVETSIAAVLLMQAAQRLSERIPAWMYSKMPELKVPDGE